MKDPRSDDTMNKSHWAIPEKKPNGGVEDILFWKTPWNFSFFYFIPINSRQNKAQPPGCSTKLC